MGRMAVGASVAAALCAAGGSAAAAGPPAIPSPLQLPAVHRGAVVTVRWTPLPLDAWTAGSGDRGYAVEAFEGAPDGVPEATADAGDGTGSGTLSGLADGRTYTVRVRSRETVAGAVILSPPGSYLVRLTSGGRSRVVRARIR